MATEFALINLSTNFNLQKCDETGLNENLPNVSQSIWNKTSLLVATATEHAFMARLQWAMIVSLSVIAPQNNVHNLSQDAKSSLRLQCDIAGNASKVAISSNTMADWQHGSKHVEVWRQWLLSPWEQNRNKRPPFHVDVTVCDGDYEERPLRITVLVELRLCLLICSTERKTGLQQHHVKMCKYGICMEYGKFVPFHRSNLPFHTSAIPYSIPIFSFHSIFHTDFFLPFHIPFHTIPYHSMPWLVVQIKEGLHFRSPRLANRFESNAANIAKVLIKALLHLIIKINIQENHVVKNSQDHISSVFSLNIVKITKTLCDRRIHHHVSCSQLFGFFLLGACRRQPRNCQIHRQVCWKRHRICGVLAKERNVGFVGFLGNVEPKWCREYRKWLCCEIS